MSLVERSVSRWSKFPSHSALESQKKIKWSWLKLLKDRKDVEDNKAYKTNFLTFPACF